MRPMLRRVFASVTTTAATVVVLFASTALAQAAYTITDLGTLGGSSSAGFAINNSGQVTGRATTSGGATHAFVISPPYTSMNDLGTLGGNTSEGFAINDSGQVVGGAAMSSGVAHAFLISPPYTSMIDLGTLAGSSSTASGINSSGQVTGRSVAPDEVFPGLSFEHAFLISPPYTTMIDLGTLIPSVPESEGQGINTSGQVTGWANDPTAPTTQFLQAFLISPPYTSMTTLANGRGFAINDSGQVTGEHIVDFDVFFNPIFHAFLISPPYTSTIDLGTLGGSSSAGFAINSSGQVVGQSGTAFLYTTANGMVDLNTLIPSGSGWTLSEARGINDAGQITGTGINPNGAAHAFLLTPVPTITALINLVQSFHLHPFGIENSLVVKLKAAQAAGPGSASCAGLSDFIAEVNAQSGKKLTITQANQLIAEANQIKATLDCL